MFGKLLESGRTHERGESASSACRYHNFSDSPSRVDGSIPTIPLDALGLPATVFRRVYFVRSNAGLYPP